MKRKLKLVLWIFCTLASVPLMLACIFHYLFFVAGVLALVAGILGIIGCRKG
ncbi:MAG: hypothetical protein IKB86_07395 [Clostridia bacterium]|nr:hypothetical protein [Clostridia bacterium]